MLRIKTPGESLHVVQHSRFIGFALSCESLAELKARLSDVARQHPTAHHLCFAYRIRTAEGLQAHCSDAGEPSGTAGRPILAQLEGSGVVDAVVAVIRYFGGIKLGAGGLVRAYSATARMALDAAEKETWIEWAMLKLTIDYGQLQRLTYELEKLGGEILEKDFGARVELTIRLPAAELGALRQRFT